MKVKTKTLTAKAKSIVQNAELKNASGAFEDMPVIGEQAENHRWYDIRRVTRQGNHHTHHFGGVSSISSTNEEDNPFLKTKGGLIGASYAHVKFP